MLKVQFSKSLGGFSLEAAFSGADKGVTVLFGPSGAGKSSILACVAGASRPDSGRIELDGEALFDSASRIDLPMERRRIGWVFQDARLFPHLSVAGNLRFGLKRAPAGDTPIRFDEVVSVLGIERLLHRRPRDLSGGERQRVGLGRALLSQPRLLLMDEPLASLDAARRAEILPFFEQLKTRFGVPVLYVTHSLAEAVRLGDRMAVIHEGRVTAQGSLGEVVAQAGSRAQLGAALDGRVTRHDDQMSLVQVGAWDFRVPRIERSAGASLRLFVLARDVMLALDPPSRISARNVLPGQIVSIDEQEGQVLVRLTHDGQTLVCALTPDAVADLQLQPGMPAWAVVKSVAIDGLGGRLLSALEA